MPPKVMRSPTKTRSATAAGSSAASDDESSVSAPTPTQLVMTETQLAALVESITRAQAEANRQLMENIFASGRATPPSSNVVTPADTMSAAAPTCYGNFSKCSARFRGGAANDDDVLEAFINSVEVYRECTNITDEHALRGLPMLLEGDAAVWWQGVKASTTSWQGAIDGLRAMFGVPRPAHKVFRDIFSKEQRDGEKSDVFINRVRASLSKLPYRLLEETQIDIVYGLLSSSIRERLPRKECPTMCDLIDKARDIVIPKAKSQSASKPSDTGVRHTNSRGSGELPISSKSNSPNIRCYGCGQPGVIKSKCPTCNVSDSNKVKFQGVDIYSTEHNDTTRAIVEVGAAGCRGVAVLDSGATHSLASPGLFSILRDSGVQFTESQYTFGLADGTTHVSKVLCCDTHIVLEGREIPVTFAVLPDANNRTLLGNDFMKTAGIVIDIARASWSFSDVPSISYPFVLKYALECDAELMQPAKIDVALRDNEGLKLDTDQRVRLNRLLEKHCAVFADKGPATDFAVHCIKVKENQQPIACPPYRLSPSKKDLLNKELQKLLENDVIEECESPWAANVVLVNKKDGGVRLCVDYRKLNAVTEPDCYPLPRMEDILHAAKTSNYMTTLDLRSGYFQCLVRPEDRDKTSFTSPLGTFRWRRMPMGLRNSGATFQRLIDRFKSNLKCKDKEGDADVTRDVRLLAYLDDLIILSDNFSQHLEDLEAVFERLKLFNLRVHRQKSMFARDSVRFLGHVIVPGGLQADPQKVDAIANMPPPRNLKHLMSFIQTTSWFRRFIPNYADEARPLTSLLKKDVAWCWAEPQQRAFEKLKSQLVSAPILRQADDTKPYVLRTDSSGYCLGAVLLQGEGLDERPIEYASRLLTPAEKNYNTTEREALAIVWAVTKFRGYIEGAEVLVKSDHQPLKWLMNLKSPSGRLARWALTLQEYNLRIEYTPGKANVVADMLSRPSCVEEPTCDLCYTTVDIPTRQPGDVRENQLSDPEVKKIVDDLESNEPFKARVWADRGYVISDGILYRLSPDCEDAESPCLVVPAHERSRVLRELHDAPTAGHCGAERTLLRVAERFYWPGMRTFINDYVKKCVPCQRCKVDTRKPAGLLQTPAMTRRFEVVSVDLFGPLPETVNHNKWILIVEDVCSRWVEIFPLKNATSMECAKLLIDEIFFRYGVPRRMTSDNGVQFVSEVMQQACHVMGMTQDLTPLYHPESNPIERKNRDLKPQLAILVGQDHTTWDAHISAIRFAMNSAVTASTGFTPAYLTFGRELRTPLDAVTDMRAILERDNFVPTVTPYLKRMSNALLQARDVHEKAQRQQKKYADEGRRDVPLYQVGDLVLLKTEGQNSAAPGQTPKFIPRRDGPYRVNEACSPVSYVLVDPSTEENIDLPKYSKVHTQTDEYLEINERFQWDLGETQLNPGETLVVHLIQRTRWNKEKVLGVYRLGLQVLASDRSLEITDALVSDVTNQSTMVFVEMQVFYDPADESPGTAERMAGFINKKPIAGIPSVHTSKKVSSGKQALNVQSSSTHQATRSSVARQSYVSRRANTFSHAPMFQQGLTSPLAQSAIKSPSSGRGAVSPIPLTHTSPKLRTGLNSPTSQKGDTSPLPLTHTSPKSRQAVTSPKNRQGLPSPASRTSPTDFPMTHRSPTSQKAIASPPSRQVVTSPLSRQTIASPQATHQQISSSFPSAFHQALMTKYAKNEKELLPGIHKSTSSLSSQQGSRQSSPRESARESGQSSVVQSDGDETDPLIHVERNIATLEKSLKSKDAVIEIDSGDDNTISRGYKLKQVGKRIFRRHWSFGETSAERAVKYMPASDLAPKHKSKKTSTFRSVKNLMRLGKSRNRTNSGDEEMGLLDVAAGTSAPDITTSQNSVSSEEAVLVDIRSPPETPKMTKKMRSLTESGGPMALKAADFQVCVTIIEARQLAGLNMDPIVAVQVGDSKKYTSVKESTNCPYYNEYFVFDFHMPPVMLLDKIITLSVQQSRHMFRSNKLLGSFKLDVATIWNQPDRQFYHKWALLTDPDDIAAGPKGFLKCDISVIGKGDQIKVPPKSEKDEDDIEANLLLPDGVPLERQRARFIVRIHKADGLPKMNYSLMANVKKAFTGETQDLVDPYVEVSFAGMSGQTTVRKNTYCPVWNEQIIFTEMFPPLCQRIKIQLKDHDAINHQNSHVIGTHFMDLGKISHDGNKGFLPTFGPAYIHLYGSTRDYSLIDQHSNLNDGMGEGVSYRGRILISIRTEVMDILECPQSTEVELECIPPITDSALGKNEDFFLFGSIFEASMIDKRLVDKPLYFELSIGNSGNSLDGNMEAIKKPKDYFVEDIEKLKVDTGFWHSTTLPCRAPTNDKTYHYVPIWDHKQCMQIRSIWPDHRRRMYNSNMISIIIEKLEEGLADAEVSLNNELYEASVLTLKSTLEAASNACSSYVRHMSNAPQLGNTKLDQEKQRLCLHELGKLSVLTKNLKALITKNSMKERLRTSHTFLNRLRHLCEDAQHSMPDVFVWLISNGKRLAYHRIPAREIIYSDVPDETGKYCAKMQTLFLKWPGKKAAAPSGWAIPAKISIYLWLGSVVDKAHYLDGLPPGYEMTNELKNAELPQSIAPQSIFYSEKRKFQMRSYIYQARSLIGSDASGLSDPFARIIINDLSQTTQVIDQTLSPTWDETLVFEDITLYSTIENIKADPPTVVIEIFDQDSVGKAEFIGRTLVKPFIKSLEDIRDRPPCLPALEWHDIRRGDDMAGELLATFELLELVDDESKKELPSLPSPRLPTGKPPGDLQNKGPILPVPRGIRPTLSKYRIEVLFWGLRDLKRVHFLTVDKPRVDIECSGHTLTSTMIQNAKQNPNFNNPTKFIELELPDQDVYQPPLTIRVVDCRSFGRNVLVGTHTINSIQKYIFTPMSKRERDIEDRKKSLIQLQNVDLRANCIIQEDVFTIGHERENMPLLPWGASTSNEPKREQSPRRTRSLDRSKRGSRKRKASADSILNDDDAHGTRDWWTKYFASYDVMIEEMKDKKCKGGHVQPAQASTSAGVSSRSGSPARCDRKCGGARRKVAQSPKGKVQATSAITSTKKNIIPKSALTRVIPHELEAVPEYEEFKEWLHTFDLYRGKKTGDDSDDESRVVGSFKGAIKVYKWPLPRGIDDSTIMGHDPNYGFFQGVPNNDPIHVLVRIYIVKATDLHPMDMNGKADPYIVLYLGNKKIADQEQYVSKQLNPVFGKCYEIEATFPQDSNLTIAVYDWDLVGADEMIGETKIDLENRFYSRHRATCGLPQKYEETGYNRWRDSLKPTQILAKLCKDGKLEPPVYECTRVKIGRTVFNMPVDDELFTNPDTKEEQMALLVLRRWEEVPRVGCHLVTEHVETRSLYNPSKPGIEQGRLEMWVDMFPMDMPAPGPPLDISPRKPKSYEMRVIIWNTDDVVLEDDAFFTGEKMSDIYVKGWVKGPDDCQSTDIHYRSLTGEGNFNWRFVYPFEYLEAEERIVTSRKESLFSWDETECKIPARLELQVWDADHFSADDFLGALTLDLNRFPRGAKSAKLCTLEMLCNDGAVPTINIFKQKRVRGWWPFYIKRDTEEMELTGKVEAEIQLLTREDADRLPAGLGRSEPEPLEKPNRPDASFMWFLNPLKSMRYIMWHNYKWKIIKYGLITAVFLGAILFLYAFPGYSVKWLLGA